MELQAFWCRAPLPSLPSTPKCGIIKRDARDLQLAVGITAERECRVFSFMMKFRIKLSFVLCKSVSESSSNCFVGWRWWWVVLDKRFFGTVRRVSRKCLMYRSSETRTEASSSSYAYSKFQGFHAHSRLVPRRVHWQNSHTKPARNARTHAKTNPRYLNNSQHVLWQHASGARGASRSRGGCGRVKNRNINIYFDTLGPFIYVYVQFPNS